MAERHLSDIITQSKTTLLVSIRTETENWEVFSQPMGRVMFDLDP